MISDFDVIFEKTMGHEGGYSNDPVDRGGETYKGIARNYHPSWEGWKIIDNTKKSPKFPLNLKSINELDILVKKFYKSTFFDVFMGDNMPHALAEEMFDTGVNMGVGRAVKFLQKALNVLNKNQSFYPDIVEDGAFGPNTYNVLMKAVNNGLLSHIVKIINILQGMHYIEYATKSPTQERFMKGWLNRVTIDK